MPDRSGFDGDSLSERFTGRKQLLDHVSKASSPADWIDQVAEHTDRQSDIFLELINKCPFGIYVVDDAMRIAAMNERSQAGAFVNVRPVIGRPFEEAMRILWPENTALGIIGHFRQTLETGETYYSRDFVEARADVDHIEGYEWKRHRVRLPEGRSGVICYYFDSTELRQAQQELVAAALRQQLLIDELNHRVKNTLIIVQSLAMQTFGKGKVAPELQAAFEGRLNALAGAHDTLTSVHWERARLEDVARSAMNGCGADERVHIHGPPFGLRPVPQSRLQWPCTNSALTRRSTAHCPVIRAG
jgi:PAS domain-containing protein